MKHFDQISALLVPLALLFAPFLGVSQIGIIPPAGQQGKAEQLTVSGQVVSSRTGEPIARALVQFGDRYSALTDHEGHFEFDHASDYTGPITTMKPGYFNDTAAYPTGNPITLPMIPEAILFGSVLDPNGQPVQGLQIQLKMLEVRSGLTRWEQVQGTTTNADGEFRFADLRMGKYRVSSGFLVEGLPDESSSLALVPVVYPPPASDNGSDALTLNPGDRMQANLAPPLEKLYRVSGMIHGMVGQGAGFEIITQDGEMVSPALHVYPTGAFWSRLPTGAYHVNVTSFDQNQQLMGVREIQVGHAALEGVSITLAPQANLPVDVDYQAVGTRSQDSQAYAVPYVSLSLEQSSSAAPFRAFNAEPMGPTNTTEPPRTMVIRNVQPGRYELRAQTSGPWYVASATCGNLDLMREPMVIASDAGGCSIRVVLRNDAASLKWSIAPGESVKESGADNPRRSASVVAVPLGNLTQSLQAANAQDSTSSPISGAFIGLAPGRYLILALKQPQELPYRDPGAIERYLPLGQEVTLSRDGQAEVQLNLAAGEP